MLAIVAICQQIWETQQWPQDWKRSVFISIPKKGNAKECSNYRTITLISHASKIMLKILQARLHQYMNRELPDVQAGFRKGRRIRVQTANIRWIIEKGREVPPPLPPPHKTYFCFTEYASKFGKLSSGHRTGKSQFSFQSQRKAMPKNVQITAQLHSSHTLAK